MGFLGRAGTSLVFLVLMVKSKLSQFPITSVPDGNAGGNLI